MRVFAILSPCFIVFVYFSFLFGILFVGFVHMCSCVLPQYEVLFDFMLMLIQNLTERKGLLVTSTLRHVNQSKNYIDNLQAGVLRTEVEEPSIGEKLLLAGLELCDKVGEERVTLAARW